MISTVQVRGQEEDNNQAQEGDDRSRSGGPVESPASVRSRLLSKLSEDFDSEQKKQQAKHTSWWSLPKEFAMQSYIDSPIGGLLTFSIAVSRLPFRAFFFTPPKFLFFLMGP